MNSPSSTQGDEAWGPWQDTYRGREVFRQHGETGRVQEMNAAYANRLEAEARAARLATDALRAYSTQPFDVWCRMRDEALSAIDALNQEGKTND